MVRPAESCERVRLAAPGSPISTVPALSSMSTCVDRPTQRLADWRNQIAFSIAAHRCAPPEIGPCQGSNRRVERRRRRETSRGRLLRCDRRPTPRPLTLGAGKARSGAAAASPRRQPGTAVRTDTKRPSYLEDGAGRPVGARSARKGSEAPSRGFVAERAVRLGATAPLH
jgi:hypothetical protein